MPAIRPHRPSHTIWTDQDSPGSAQPNHAPTGTYPDSSGRIWTNPDTNHTRIGRPPLAKTDHFRPPQFAETQCFPRPTRVFLVATPEEKFSTNHFCPTFRAKDARRARPVRVEQIRTTPNTNRRQTQPRTAYPPPTPENSPDRPEQPYGSISPQIAPAGSRITANLPSPSSRGPSTISPPSSVTCATLESRSSTLM